MCLHVFHVHGNAARPPCLATIYFVFPHVFLTYSSPFCQSDILILVTALVSVKKLVSAQSSFRSSDCILGLFECSLTALRKLSLQSNRLTSMAGLTYCTQLEELYLSHNGISALQVSLPFHTKDSPDVAVCKEGDLASCPIDRQILFQILARSKCHWDHHACREFASNSAHSIGQHAHVMYHW